jgi:hypothetical protein
MSPCPGWTDIIAQHSTVLNCQYPDHATRFLLRRYCKAAYTSQPKEKRRRKLDQERETRWRLTDEGKADGENMGCRCDTCKPHQQLCQPGAHPHPESRANGIRSSRAVRTDEIETDGRREVAYPAQ